MPRHENPELGERIAERAQVGRSSQPGTPHPLFTEPRVVTENTMCHGLVVE